VGCFSYNIPHQRLCERDEPQAFELGWGKEMGEGQSANRTKRLEGWLSACLSKRKPRRAGGKRGSRVISGGGGTKNGEIWRTKFGD